VKDWSAAPAGFGDAERIAARRLAGAAEKVPLLDLSSQHASIRAELDAAIARVVGSGRYILGEQVAAFEKALAAYCGATGAVGMSSGTDALLVSLQALDVGPGDEVVTTPFTFFATAGVIHRLGARPVFADIEPDGLNIAPAALAGAVSGKTKAVIPVHIFGQCADMEPILDECSRRGVAVVEDACQAIGADIGGRRAGTMGCLAAFSFFPTKNLGALGDAGAVTAMDSSLLERVRALRVHGESSRYVHREVGINGRLDELQAAILLVKLAHLEEYQSARIRNAARYAELFAEASLAADELRLPAALPGRRHVFHQYVVRARDRDRLVEHLHSRGIGCAVYYPRPLHLQECFGYLGYKEGDFPVAEQACREVLALPIYPELTAVHAEAVVAAVAGFYGRRV